MAAIITDIWEFRATAGAANSGGGFDTASGGTDFSNQDSAQLQLTDLATSGIGVTTLTSVTGGFTSAMVGNYIQIRSGTNVTAGFYRVTAHTDTNTVTLDRAPDDGVGGISGGSGDLGGALDILTDAFLDDADVVIAGNTIHVKNDGTMTLTGAISVLKDGTTNDPIIIDGYNISRGDCPFGANRPVIAAADNNLTFDNSWVFKNLIVTTTTLSGISADLNAMWFNCKSTNSSGSGGRNAFTGGFGRGAYIACEAVSTNGDGIDPISSNCLILACYIHDSVDGVDHSGTNDNLLRVINCVFDTCTIGLHSGAGDEYTILNNTFYNCTSGMTATSNSVSIFINNLFDNCTDGVKWDNSGTIITSNMFDYNMWSNNTRDMSWDNGSSEDNSSKGPNAITSNVTLTDPANGDFTLPTAAVAIDAGLQMGTNQGAVGDYKWNIGVDQDDNTVGGGAAATKWWGGE